MSQASNHRSRPGLRFVLTAGILSVSLFGILRIPVVEQNLLLPFTKAQHTLACRIGGDAGAPIAVGLSCSAADVIALCLGFILAFPVSWWKRGVGAALGLVFIAAVNTVRIATLTHAVRNDRWFDLLHVYIWPGVLLVVVSLFVFFWMSLSLRPPTVARSVGQPRHRRPLRSRTGVRFVLLTFLFVMLFVGTSGWWMESAAILAVANWVAATGAFVIRMLGGEATISGNVLRTASGAFIVTQECIMTPLIPAYFAAALALPMARKQRALALLAGFPVFFMLGAARLLVLAFPTRMVGSHLVAIHGFYQFLLAGILVVIAAIVSRKRPRSRDSLLRPILAALLAGPLTAVVLGLTYNRLLLWFVTWAGSVVGHGGHDYLDPQGALLVMAPYQLGLLVALWIVWVPRERSGRMLTGLAVLLISQFVVLLTLREWVAHTGIEPHVAAIRAWSVVAVLLVGGWLVRRPRRAAERRPATPAKVQHV